MFTGASSPARFERLCLAEWRYEFFRNDLTFIFNRLSSLIPRNSSESFLHK